MSRSFLLEPTKVDTQSAEAFGEIIMLFPEGCRRSGIWSPMFWPDVKLRLDTCDFDYDKDYFIVSGNMTPVAIVLAEMSRFYPWVRLLLWNAPIQEYSHHDIGWTP